MGASAVRAITASEMSGTSVLERLKAETRPEHDAIEAALGLLDPSLTQAAYCGTLSRFYGFYRPLEAGVWSLCDWREHGLEPAERRKTPLLEADLRALGVDPPQLSTCADLPPHRTIAFAFGCLYVMEGATLGGQVISRHIRQTLGLMPAAGGRFFDGYGARTGAMWRAYRTALAAFTTTHDRQDHVVDAAVQTFRKLRTWHERGSSA